MSEKANVERILGIRMPCGCRLKEAARDSKVPLVKYKGDIPYILCPTCKVAYEVHFH